MLALVYYGAVGIVLLLEDAHHWGLCLLLPQGTEQSASYFARPPAQPNWVTPWFMPHVLCLKTAFLPCSLCSLL